MASIVCDSSSLISFSETCNIEAIGFVKKKSGARFLIPEEVRQEIFVRPLKLPKYEFSAIRLNQLLEEGIVERAFPPELENKTNEFLSIANNLFFVRGNPIELIQRGEAQCLAVMQSLNADALLIDEKTTRLLVESPEQLLQRISGEYENKISVEQDALSQFRKKTREIFVMRSSELLAIAAEKGFFQQYGDFEEKAFKAGLRALRNAGCSIAEEEIKQIQNEF